MKLDTKLENLLKAINLVEYDGLSEVLVKTKDLMLLRQEVIKLNANTEKYKLENQRLLSENVKFAAESVGFTVRSGRTRLGDYIDEDA